MFPGDAVENHPQSTDKYVNDWRELFQTSVKLRLMADVPLGMFLSGGIDSSAIAAVMSRLVSDPIKTFSVAFNVPEANELDYARLAARAFHTDHHEILVEPADFAAALPHLIWHEDEPLAHSASVALYFVSQLAQRHVKVVLTGEGSDETPGGVLPLSDHAAEPCGRPDLSSILDGWHQAPRPCLRHRPRIRALRRKLPGRSSGAPPMWKLYTSTTSRCSRAPCSGSCSRGRSGGDRGRQPVRGHAPLLRRIPSATLLDRLLYVDLKTYLHELLMKQDQMSMAASIESRVPFLDHKLVEFSTRFRSD